MTSPPQRDVRGLPVMAASAEAARALDAAIDAMSAHQASTSARIADALELDPELALAHVMVGFGAVLLGRSELVPGAREAHGRAAGQRRSSTVCASDMIEKAVP